MEQIKSPFEPISDRAHRPIAWRLLFPLVWHYLSFPTWLFLVMPHVGCLLTLALTAHIALQGTGNRRTAFFTTVALAAAPWFWVSTGWLTYFDSWLIGGLLVFTFAKSRSAVALACVLTPWIDERFLLGAPLCFLIRTMNLGGDDRGRPWRDIAADGAILFVSGVTYVGLRFALAHWTKSGEVGAYLQEHLNWTRLATCPATRYLEGVWMALRAGWFLVAALLYYVFLSGRRILGAALIVTLLGTIAVALVIAIDIHRSICIVLPAALAGMLILAQHAPRRCQTVLCAIAAANLLLPGAHVLTGARGPVLYLHAEIASWQDPPSVLSPAAWSENGNQLVRKNEIARAEAFFSDALQLDGNWCPAYLGRANVRIALGNLEGAAEDVEQAVRCLPCESLGKHPDDIVLLNATAWLLATNPNASIRNGAEAIKLAERAAQLSDGQETGNPRHLGRCLCRGGAIFRGPANGPQGPGLGHRTK